MPHARLHSVPIAATVLTVMLITIGPSARIAGSVSTASLVLPTQAGCQVAGPYATMHRANEAAAAARRRGFNAAAYHDGDGYYVRTC